MELIHGGSLHHFIKTRLNSGNKVSDEEASQIMKAILTGVNYIHEKNIIHRDLKSQNIMIYNINDLSTIKLIDFGLGIKKIKANSDAHICGTYTHMPPEVVKCQDFS